MLFAVSSSFGQAYSLDITPTVANDTLFLEYRINHDSGPGFLSFSVANFEMDFDTSGLFFSEKVILNQGHWSEDSNSTCYDEQIINDDDDAHLVVNIEFDASGGGCDSSLTGIVAGQSALLAIVAIPIEYCDSLTVLKLPSPAFYNHLSSEGNAWIDDLGYNYTVNIPGGGLIVPLSNFGSFGFETSDTSFCDNERIKLSVTGVDTNLNLNYDFYHFDVSTNSSTIIATQSGSDTSFTTTASNTLETGDSVYVEISSGSCSVQSLGVTVTVSGGGSAFILTGDSTDCELVQLEMNGTVVGDSWGWYYNGNHLGTFDNQVGFNAVSNGSYYGVVETSDGCTDTTNSIPATILSQPDVTLDTIYGSTSICLGDSLGLKVTNLSGNALILSPGGGQVAIAPGIGAYDFDPGTSFTVEAQIRTTSVGAMGVLEHGDVAPSFQGFRLEMTGGSIGAVVGDGASQAIFSGPNIADGDFHHVALTVHKPTSTGVLYVDGIEVDRITNPALSNDQTATNNFNMGTGFLGDFFGSLDEIRLWNRALDSAGIVQSSNVELKGNEPFLVGLWNFNDTTLANQARDLTTNLNHATLAGGAAYEIEGGFYQSSATPTYLWSNGGAAIVGNDINTLNILAAGSYNVTVDNGVCPRTSIDVDVTNSSLSLTPLSDTTVCSNTSLLVQSGAGDTIAHTWRDIIGNLLAGDTNQFILNVTGDTIVTLELSDGGCIANDTFNVTTISSLPALDTANATDVTTDSLYFSWAPVAGAAHYEYHLTIDGVVVQAPWDSLGTDTLFGVGNLGPSLDTLVFTYRAISNCDTAEALSSTYIFGTCNDVDSIQDTAQLVFLADDSLAFVWPVVTNALTYQVRIDSNGTNVHDWQTTNSGNSYQIGGLSNDTVCIAYRAVGNCDTTYSDTACYVSYDCSTDWSGVDTTKLYCSSSFKEVLEPADTAAPDPGFFEGPGVNFASDIWFFDPQEAGAGIHTISYIGCYGLDTTSFDSVLVQAAPCIEIVDNTDLIVAFTNPRGIYTSCVGEIFFTDADKHIVVKIDTFGIAEAIVGISGTSGFKDGHSDTALVFQPAGIITSPIDDVVYFSDGSNHAIRKFDPVTKLLTTLAGGSNNENTGSNGLPGDSNIPSDSLLNRMFTTPSGLAFNSTYDTLFVADQGNHKIKSIALSDNSVRTVAGIGGAGGFVDGPTSSAEISAPAQLKFDATSNQLFFGSVTLSGFLRYVDFNSDSVKTFASNFGSQINDGTIAGGTATFSTPVDIAPDGQGNLFILDEGHCALRQYSGVTDSVITIIGSNNPNPPFQPICGTESLADRLNGTYYMDKPTALSVFVNGFVDIVDTDNDRILRIAIEDFINSPNRNLDTLYCIDDAVDTLNPNTVAGFYTSIPPGAVVDNGSHWVFTPSDTGVYTINFNHTIGACQGAESSQTYVAPLPVIDLGTDTTLCAANYGIQTLVADTIFSTYQWYFKAPSAAVYDTLIGDTSNVVVLDTLGSYILEAGTAFGCLNYDTIEVVTTPNVIPSIISDMADSICFGDTATLSVVNIGAGPGFVSYAWSTGDTTETIQVDYSDYFDVVVIDSGGCIGTDTIANIVKNRPFVCIETDSSFTNSSSLMYNEWSVAVFAGDTSNSPTAGFVDGSAYTSRFSTPYDLIKYNGALYVVEQGSNNTVRRINLADTTVSLFAGIPGFPAYTDSVGRLDAQFSFPAGIVVDEVGNFYVSNQSSHIINLISNNDSVYTIAGNPFAPTFNDGIGTAANFDDPIDMVMDRDGFIYIADFDNHRIRQLDPTTGAVTTFAGSGTNASTDGTALGASFNWPWGITRTMDGALAVAEDGGHSIRKIGLDTSVVTWSGLPGTSGDFNDTVGAITSASDARYFRPWGLGNDSDGNVFIPDGQNHTIRMLTTDNRVITLAGISGSTGNSNGKGVDATFNNPNSCFYDDSTNTLYIADKGNHNIRTLQQNKTISVCPNTSVPLDGSCSNADSYRWLDTAGTVLSSIATYTATDSGVYILEITKNGCINTDSVVVELNFAPTVTALLDTSICPGDSITLVASPDSSFASFQWVDITNGINLDTLASQIVGDTANYVVFATDSNGCVVNDTATITFKTFPTATMPALGIYCPEETDTIRIDTTQFAGLYDFTLWQDSTIADTQLIQSAGIYTANIHLDNGCVISLTDTARYHVSPTTTISALGKIQSRYLSTFNSSLRQPTDIVQTSTGDFFVSDRLNHVVYRIDASGNESVYAGALGVTGTADDAIPTNARFNTPRGLAIDKYDNLYVADVQNHVIRKIANTGVVTTFAGNGIAGFKDGATDTAQFRRPSAIGIVGSGELVVADEGNHVVRYIDPLTKVVRTIGVVGAGNTTDGTFAVAEFNSPASVYVHKAGPIFIGEEGAVRRINFGSTSVTTYDLANSGGDTFPLNTSIVGLTSNNGTTIGISSGINDRLYTSTGDPNTILVAGDSVSGFIDGRADTARFNGTGGLTIASNGRVYVTDVNNGAIRELRDSSYVNICTGDSIELTANAGGTYLWAGPNGFSATSQTVFAKDSGVYVMQFTDGTTGCLGLDSIVINHIPIPTINIDTVVALAGGPDTIFYCASDTITLIGNDTITAGYRYTWETIGGTTLGSGKSLEVTGVEETIVLTITDTTTDAFCSNRDTLRIQFFVDTLELGANQTICADACTTLDAGAGYASYLWSDSSTSQTLTVCAGGIFDVTATTADGCLVRDTVDVSVNFLPNLSIAGNRVYASTFAGDGSIGAIDNVSPLSASFNGPTDAALDSQGNLYIVDQGNELIRRIDNAGQVTTVITLPNPSAIAINKNDEIFVALFDSSKIVRITPGGARIDLTGNNTLGYQDGALSQAIFHHPFGLAIDENNRIFVADAGNDAVRIIDIKKDSVSTIGTPFGGVNAPGTFTTATFQHPAEITIDENGDAYVATGGGVINVASQILKIDVRSQVVSTFNAAGNDITYVSVNGITDNLVGDVIFSKAQPFVGIVDQQTGIASKYVGEGIPQSLDGFDTLARVHQPSGIEFDPINNVVFMVDQLGHRVRLFRDSSQVAYCTGDSAQLVASVSGGNSGIFSWSTGSSTNSTFATSPGQYTVTFTDGTTGCSNSDTVTVSEVPNPTVANIISDTTICLNDTVALFAQAASASDVVVWSFVDTTIPDTVFVSSQLGADTILVDSSIVGMYIATISNGGCDTSIAVTVTLTDVISSIVATKDTLCYLESTLLDGRGSSSIAGIASYLWDTTGASGTFAPAGLTSDTLSISPNTPGVNTYVLTVTDSSGCTALDSIDVIVGDSLIATFSLDTLHLCNNVAGSDSVTAVITGGFAPLTFNWSTIATSVLLTNTDSASVLIAPAGLGADTAQVAFTLTDGSGCSLNDSVTAVVHDFVILATVANDTICPNEPNQLNANIVSGGIGGFNYSWTPGSSLDADSIANPISTTGSNVSYQVIVIDSVTGCSDTSSVDVVVRDLVAVIGNVADADTLTVCFGDSSILDASNSNGGSAFGTGSPYRYTWTQLVGDASGLGGAGDTLITDTIFGATVATVSQVELIVTDSLGCSDRDTVSVFWNNQITVNILTDSIICLNIQDSLQSASSGGSGTLLNNWSVSTSLGGNLSIVGANNQQDLDVLSITNLDSSIVVLEVTDSLGCSSEDSALVVTQQLIATLVANVDTSCAGADVILTAGDSLSVGAVSFDFGFGPQASNTITLNSLNDTTYTVVVRDSATNCVSTASVNVVIRNLDAIIGAVTDPDTLALCLSASHILDASNSFGGKTFLSGSPYRYVWSQLSGDANGIGGVADTLISDTVSGGTPTTFSQIELLLTDSIGCTDRDTLVLYWNDSVNVSISSDPFACLGAVDSLQGSATGGLGSYSYNWEILTGQLGGQLTTVGVTNQANLAVQGNVNLDSSYVKLTVTDSIGCAASDSVIIQTRQLFAFLISNFDTVCGGFPVLLTATDSLAIGSLAYDFGSGFQADDTMSVSSATTTTYSVTVLDSATGCQATATKEVVVEDIVLSVGPSDTIVCFSDSVVAVYANVTGGASPLTYSWLRDLSTPTGGNSDTIFVVPAPQGTGVSTTYQVTVTDSLGCSQTTATIARFDEIQIGRNFEITVDAGTDTIICFNSAINVGGAPTAVRSGGTNPADNFTYDWQSVGATFSPSGDANPLFNPLVGGATYNVQLTVTDNNVAQCQVNDSLTIDVRDIPVVEMPDTSFWCGSEVLILPDTNITYPVGTTYEWTLNTVTIAGADSSTYLVASAGTYEFIVSDSIGCSDSDQTEVLLRALPTISVSDLGTVICTNASINLSANVSPAGGTFLWTHDGSGSIDDDEDEVTFYIPGFSDNGQTLEFIGAYTTECGTVTDTTSPQAATPPTALFDVADTIVNTNEPVAYADASIGNNLTYNWTFQLTSTTQQVEFSFGPHVIEYAEDGTFNSLLEVTDQSTTCSDTFSVNITVIGSNVLFVPNVFSPLAQNADNQSLKVFGTNISDTEFEFTVYNRWGEVIYQTLSSTEAMNVGWTGVNQNNGNESEMGSYTYTLKGRFFDGKEIVKSGSVTLIR